MTKKSQLAIELSEKREKINSLLGLPDGELTTEQRSELDGLTVRLQQIEPELKGRDHPRRKRTKQQTVSTGEGTAEERELRALRGRVGLTRYIEAASEKRNVDGAEAEFNQALKRRRSQVPAGTSRSSRGTRNHGR